MDLNSALYSLISNVGAEVYPNVAPQTDLPIIVHSTIYTEFIHAQTKDTELIKKTIQISVYSETSLEAHNISEKVRATLQNYSGAVDGVEIQAVLMENEIEGHDGSSHFVHTDYTIFYKG